MSAFLYPPATFPKSAGRRTGPALCSGGFVFLFFLPGPEFELGLGVSDGDSRGFSCWRKVEEPADVGSSRLALNAEINSNAAGESPRRFLRWSAPSSLERVAV